MKLCLNSLANKCTGGSKILPRGISMVGIVGKDPSPPTKQSTNDNTMVELFAPPMSWDHWINLSKHREPLYKGLGKRAWVKYCHCIK